MAVGLTEPENILPIDGIELATVACGIKSNSDDDLLLIKINSGASCAATFTKNAFCAAPVLVAKEHLKKTLPQALLINSGNANAGTGTQGMQDALQSCSVVAKKVGCKIEQVLPFSTGVIGEKLPMPCVESGVEIIASQLNPDQWLAAANAIKTTDTIAKAISKQIDINGQTVTITGIVKGSGMICPDMATLLAFIATDARVENAYLQQCLNRAVMVSFNAITVDGDTSTNDACVLIASGRSNNDEIHSDSESANAFQQAISDVCRYLAQAVIRDGEGATKFVTINVETAYSINEARNLAYTIAHSPLVKTALFASDPNWGRRLAAVGRAGIEDFNLEKVNIYLDEVCIVHNGARDSGYKEEAGQEVMDKEELTIKVELNRGDVSTTVWTTDLSHEYISINSTYRT